MVIGDEILKQKTDFTDLCIKHIVKYLYAFGSSTTNKFNLESSDIDLIVEIDEPDPIERGEKLMSLWETFERARCSCPEGYTLFKFNLL